MDSIKIKEEVDRTINYYSSPSPSPRIPWTWSDKKVKESRQFAISFRKFTGLIHGFDLGRRKTM